VKLKPAASVSGRWQVGQWLGWLFFALLLALLLLLLGFAFGRRRPAPVHA
jgi:hypothetical protein